MNLAPSTLAAAADDGRPGAGALTDLFARHQDELLGTLFYLVGNLEDARDALQETFLKCWRRQADLAQVENLKAWVFCVAMNTGRDLRGAAWRRRRQPLVGDEAMPPVLSATPHGQVVEQERLARLRVAVGQLRAEEQEVFLLRQNGELTYDEIAAAVGIPVGTVKTRMRLALSRLREALFDDE